jgi:hypothetical protein
LKKKQARVATSNDVPPNWLGNITEKLYSAQIEPKNITRKLRSAQIESKNITENYGLVRLKKKHHWKIVVCSNLQKTSLKTGPKLKLYIISSLKNGQNKNKRVMKVAAWYNALTTCIV